MKPHNSTRFNREHSRRPIPAVAVVQALYFKFRVRTTEIARLMGWKPQDVSRATVCECFKGVPWEARNRQAEAIREAQTILHQETI